MANLPRSEMRSTVKPYLCALMIALCLGCDSSSSRAGDVEIQFYLLQAPGNAHDIEQASGLH